MHWVISLLLLSQQPTATLVCTVSADGVRIAGAEVVVAGRTSVTGTDGVVRIPIEAGEFTITVAKEGFAPLTTFVTVAPGAEHAVVVELQRQPTVEEHVTVSATRTDNASRNPDRVESSNEKDERRSLYA